MTLAAWRLQLTSLLLFPGAVIQYRNLAPGDLVLMVSTSLMLCDKSTQTCGL